MPGVAGLMLPHVEGPREGPSWLPDLLRGQYFVPCHFHAAAHKSERNFFCADCGGEPLCSLCVSKNHAGHSTMQIRRSSYHEVVRVSDMQRLLDLSYIQVYVINSAKIVFLNGRPQAKPMKGAPYSCETCHRTLLDNCRFCSIECKRKCTSSDGTISLQPRLQSLPSGSLGIADMGDESGESAGGMQHMSRKKLPVTSLKKRTLPPLLLDDGDSGEASTGDSGGEEQFLMMKRQRRTGSKGHQTAVPPPLEATSPTSSIQAPGTPPLSPVPAFPIWKLHRRKGVPHRAPLW